MPILQSHVVYFVATAMVGVGALLATTVAGLTPAELMQFNLALNVAMFGFILRNTVQISRLQGRYGADHEP